MSNFVSKIIEFFKELADWVEENMGDPAIAEAIRADLNLKPGQDIPKSEQNQVQQFAKGLDPDDIAFAETVEELREIVEFLITLGNQIGSNAVSGWDVLYAFGKLSTAESIRIKRPLLYALGQFFLFFSSDPHQLAELDPEQVLRIANGEEDAFGDGEKNLQRLMAITSLIGLLDGVLSKFLGGDYLDVYHGWDSPPDTNSPIADRISNNASTFVFKSKGDLAGQLAMTLVPVSSAFGGPGLMTSFGGALSFKETLDNVDYELDTGFSSAFDLWIPFSEEAPPFVANGDVNAFVKFAVTHQGQDADEPTLRIGDADGTRFDIGAIGTGVDLLGEGFAARLSLQRGELIIKLNEGDGFLQSLSATPIRLGFSLDVTVDSNGGLRIDGGTLLRASLPINKTVGGFLDMHDIDVSLAPILDEDDPGFSLILGTAMGLKLGPFQASVDEIGFRFDVRFREGNLGIIDANIGFNPPAGVGLLLNAGIVKGGGYLFIDSARGEYAGALELKFARWGIKAIGTLSTRMPDGSPGFALLLLIYADLPRFHIAFGIFFEGVGGVLGLQHGADIDALKSEMPKGVFDDILFPANPVADAPRIINRLRIIFPIRPHAFLIGPMFKLTWGTPAVGSVQLGVILGIDNALGTDAPVSLQSIILLGTVRIGLPSEAKGDVARIICDFLGYLDFDSERFGFYARLRNSRLVGSLELTGSLVLRIDYGSDATFLIAAGGFHPRFNDLPSGLPAKLDRMGLKFSIGIVKVSISCYLAVTTATVQFGAQVDIVAKIGPVSLSGWLGFDALIYYEPVFRFELDFRAGVAIKFKSFNLMSVDVRGTLRGPGLWHITGRFSFSVLWWDIEKSFDEQWGEQPVLAVATTNVAALLQSALNNPDNWVAALPINSDSLVTLAALAAETDIVAHPLGQLRVTQKIVPLGLSIEKYGETRVDGANRFDLQVVSIGSTAISNPQTTQEQLARGNYLDQSEEDRLTKPSFEKFDVGIAVGSEDFVIPASAIIDGSLDYETRKVEPHVRSDFPSTTIPVFVQEAGIKHTMAVHQASIGAVSRSDIHRSRRLRSAAPERVRLSEPGLQVMGSDGFAVDALPDGAAQNNVSLAEQALVDRDDAATLQLVEAFELV